MAEAEIAERQKLVLAKSISSYRTWAAGAASEQIINAITDSFKRQEGAKMAEMVQNSFIQEGIEIGEARGEIRGRIEDISLFLKNRFGVVPERILVSLNGITDIPKLRSLLLLSSSCSSLDEFEAALR